MKYEDFRNEISKNKFNNTYLFYGDDEFLKQSVYNALKTSVTRFDNREYDEFKFDETSDIYDFISQCETFTFTGNPKIIKYTDSGIFSDAARSDIVTDAISYDDKDTLIVFVETKIDKKNESFKLLDTKNLAYDISKPKINDLRSYVNNRFTRQNKRISYDNCDILIEYSGLDLSFLSMNIDKILIYMQDEKQVSRQMIDNLATGITDKKGWQLTAALCNKNFDTALDVYYDMRTLKYGFPYFSAILFNTFFEMYTVKISSHSEINLSDFKVRRAYENANKFTHEKLKNILKIIRDKDHRFKNGLITEENAMISIFTYITKT